jgi:hypothetical protein
MQFPEAQFDQAPEPFPDGQMLVESVLLSSKKLRFLVTQGDDGVFRVFEEHWNTTWVGEGGPAFWCRNGPMALVASAAEAVEWIRPQQERSAR